MYKKLVPTVVGLFAIVCNVCFAQQPGTLLWSYNAGSTITTSPAIAPDATIYIGTGNALYAITNAGSNKWTFPASVASSPAIASDGTIYFGSQDGNFHAVNAGGSEKWAYPAQGGGGGLPAIDRDGTAYIEGYAYLYAINPSGTKKWQYDMGDQLFSSPSIGADAAIYLGSHDGHLFLAINPDATEKWRFELPTAPGNSAAIGADGTIYMTADYLYALSPNGSNLWSSSTGAFRGASPSIGKDGTIYVGTPNDLGLFAFAPDGTQKWRAIPHGIATNTPPTTPAVDAMGTIYYCGSNSVFALTPQGSPVWAFFSGDAAALSPAIGPDGTIYAAFGSTLYALKGTNALGSTPWPMYRQNLRHTGKVEKPALQAPKKRADANFQFQLAGEVGQTYNIQRSADLLLWSTFTNLVATNPPATFVDLSASNFNSNFYRAVLQ